MLQILVSKPNSKNNWEIRFELTSVEQIDRLECECKYLRFVKYFETAQNAFKNKQTKINIIRISVEKKPVAHNKIIILELYRKYKESKETNERKKKVRNMSAINFQQQQQPYLEALKKNATSNLIKKKTVISGESSGMAGRGGSAGGSCTKGDTSTFGQRQAMVTERANQPISAAATSILRDSRDAASLSALNQAGDQMRRGVGGWGSKGVTSAQRQMGTERANRPISAVPFSKLRDPHAATSLRASTQADSTSREAREGWELARRGGSVGGGCIKGGTSAQRQMGTERANQPISAATFSKLRAPRDEAAPSASTSSCYKVLTFESIYQREKSRNSQQPAKNAMPEINKQIGSGSLTTPYYFPEGSMATVRLPRGGYTFTSPEVAKVEEVRLRAVRKAALNRKKANKRARAKKAKKAVVVPDKGNNPEAALKSTSTTTAKRSEQRKRKYEEVNGSSSAGVDHTPKLTEDQRQDKEARHTEKTIAYEAKAISSTRDQAHDRSINSGIALPLMLNKRAPDARPAKPFLHPENLQLVEFQKGPFKAHVVANTLNITQMWSEESLLNMCPYAPIRKGDIVAVYLGVSVTNAQVAKMTTHEKMFVLNAGIDIGYIDGSITHDIAAVQGGKIQRNMGPKCNHSDHPNAEIVVDMRHLGKGFVAIIALGDIYYLDEVTIRYNDVGDTSPHAWATVTQHVPLPQGARFLGIRIDITKSQSHVLVADRQGAIVARIPQDQAPQWSINSAQIYSVRNFSASAHTARGNWTILRRNLAFIEEQTFPWSLKYFHTKRVDQFHPRRMISRELMQEMICRGIKSGALSSKHKHGSMRPMSLSDEPAEKERIGKYYCYLAIFYSIWMAPKHTESAKSDRNEHGTLYSQLTPLQLEDEFLRVVRPFAFGSSITGEELMRHLLSYMRLPQVNGRTNVRLVNTTDGDGTIGLVYDIYGHSDTSLMVVELRGHGVFASDPHWSDGTRHDRDARELHGYYHGDHSKDSRGKGNGGRGGSNSKKTGPDQSRTPWGPGQGSNAGRGGGQGAKGGGQGAKGGGQGAKGGGGGYIPQNQSDSNQHEGSQTGRKSEESIPPVNELWVKYFEDEEEPEMAGIDEGPAVAVMSYSEVAQTQNLLANHYNPSACQHIPVAHALWRITTREHLSHTSQGGGSSSSTSQQAATNRNVNIGKHLYSFMAKAILITGLPTTDENGWQATVSHIQQVLQHIGLEVDDDSAHRMQSKTIMGEHPLTKAGSTRDDGAIILRLKNEVRAGAHFASSPMTYPMYMESDAPPAITGISARKRGVRIQYQLLREQVLDTEQQPSCYAIIPDNPKMVAEAVLTLDYYMNRQIAPTLNEGDLKLSPVISVLVTNKRYKQGGIHRRATLLAIVVHDVSLSLRLTSLILKNSDHAMTIWDTLAFMWSLTKAMAEQMVTSNYIFRDMSLLSIILVDLPPIRDETYARLLVRLSAMGITLMRNHQRGGILSIARGPAKIIYVRGSDQHQIFNSTTVIIQLDEECQDSFYKSEVALYNGTFRSTQGNRATAFVEGKRWEDIAHKVVGKASDGSARTQDNMDPVGRYQLQSGQNSVSTLSSSTTGTTTAATSVTPQASSMQLTTGSRHNQSQAAASASSSTDLVLGGRSTFDNTVLEAIQKQASEDRKLIASIQSQLAQQAQQREDDLTRADAARSEAERLMKDKSHQEDTRIENDRIERRAAAEKIDRMLDMFMGLRGDVQAMRAANIPAVSTRSDSIVSEDTESDEDGEESEEGIEQGRSIPTGAGSKETKNPSVLPQTTAAGVKVKGPKQLSALEAGYKEKDQEQQQQQQQQQQDRSSRSQERMKKAEGTTAGGLASTDPKKKKPAKSKKETSTAEGAAEEESKIEGDDRSNNKSQQQQEAQQQGLMPGSAGPG